MAKVKDGETLHSEAIDQFSAAQTAEKEQRELAIEDLRFVNAEDGQWEEDVVEKRQDRPRYTINKIAPVIDQLVGDQRQSRVAIKVLPQQDADKKIADVYTGLIRGIEQLSNADNAYDNASTEQITCGFGGFRIVTDYCYDDSFEQDIKIKPINSAASSLFFDPAATEYDRRDANYAFLIQNISKEEFKRKYPKAEVKDFKVIDYTTNAAEWFQDETIQIAEYWYKEPVKKRLGLMSDGATIDLDEEKDILDELALEGITVEQERVVESYKIKMCEMNGAEILSGPHDWAGRYIPLVPVFGKVTVIEGKRYVRGITRFAIDAQRIYNYSTSTVVESTALAPKDPIWYTSIQVAGHETKWKNFPTKNSPFMPFTPDPATGGQPPSRGGAPQVQSALLQQQGQATSDIHATTGLEPASLGNVPELKSGKAIQAQQAMGDRGSFLFQDNLQKSISYAGDILIDLIPKIYDSERVVQVLGPDEAQDSVTINQTVIDRQTGKEVILNDLSQGKYSTIAKAGPSFSTKKQESADQLIKLAGGAPIIQELAIDLIVKNLDINDGDEIVARLRKGLIEAKRVEPTEEEAQEMGLNQAPPPDPMNEALIANLQSQTEENQIKVMETISKIENTDADTQSKVIKNQQESMNTLATAVETLIKKVDAMMPLTQTDKDILEAQEALTEEAQLNLLKLSAEQLPSGPMPAAPQPQGAPMPQQPAPEVQPPLPPMEQQT
jgi:hypothetical protein